MSRNRPALNPYITVKNTAEAIAFYEKAFAAKETAGRMTDSAGRVMHAELTIGDSVIMLADEMPEFGNTSPETLGGTPVVLNLNVEDADAVAKTAEEAGAEVLFPVADQFYGYRSGRLKDPFGHIWVLSQLLEELSDEEMQRRANELFGGTNN
ncbi:MAG: VOC family protein [Calditrichia bacterium]